MVSYAAMAPRPTTNSVRARRALFGFVPQHESLVSGSVAENIAYGTGTLTDLLSNRPPERRSHTSLSKLCPQGTTRIWARLEVGSPVARNSGSA